MELPPLIERELRVALRKQSPRKVRLGATVGVATATAARLVSRNRRRALANRLILIFREVAQEPIPAEDDPRLKRWQLDQRLPLDDARLQAELVERVVRRRRHVRR